MANVVTCATLCGKCNLFPCGLLADLDNEILKNAREVNGVANDVMADLAALNLPDTNGILNVFSDYLTTYPTTDVLTLSDLAQILGLPYNNDKARLSALGLGVIGDVGWILDGTNFSNYRTLYRALGQNYALTKAALSGANGNVFIVTTLPKLFRLVSPTPKPLTLEEITDALNYNVIPSDTLTMREGDAYVTYVYSEDFIGINQKVSDSAALVGVTPNEVNVKLFSLNGVISMVDANKLRALGLSNDQIVTLQGISLDDTRIGTLLQEAITLTSTTSISARNLIAAKQTLNTVIGLTSFSYYQLDPNLLKLNDKNNDSQIEVALQEIFINGIKVDASNDELKAKFSEINEIEAGSHNISNVVINTPVNSGRQNLLRLYRALSQLNSAKAGDNTTSIATDLISIRANLLAGTTDNENVPNITYKSYDSGATMLMRTVSYNNTIRITFQLKAILANPKVTFTDKALAAPLKDAYEASFKAIEQYNAKVSTFMKNLEAITSIGLSITGGGQFATSYLKCAAGLDFNLDYSALKTLLNGLINAYNDTLRTIDAILTKIIQGIVCKMRCLRDLVGLGGQSLDLPFCKVMLPTLNVDATITTMMNFTNLIDRLIVKNIDSANTVRFALFELESSISNVESDCNCAPLGGLFDAIKNTLGIPASPVKIAGVSGLPSL